jgi:hypothetical protein
MFDCSGGRDTSSHVSDEPRGRIVAALTELQARRRITDMKLFAGPSHADITETPLFFKLVRTGIMNP